MDLTELLALSKNTKKTVDGLVSQLTQISKLDRARTTNLVKLYEALRKSEQILEKIDFGSELSQAFQAWSEQYRRELIESEEQIKRKFGLELESELHAIGRTLSGQFPSFTSGIFTIDVDVTKGHAVVWYGYKQEVLGKCALSEAAIAYQLSKYQQELGSQLTEDEVLQKLRKAYLRVSENRLGKPVPIVEVLSELAHLLQSPKFHSDPQQAHYKSYSRADFSYDLFRIRHLPGRPQLTVATRDHTRRQQNFIWVPADLGTKGSTYSHLIFEV